MAKPRVLKNNSDTPAEAHVARSSDGKPYPIECCSWKVIPYRFNQAIYDFYFVLNWGLFDECALICNNSEAFCPVFVTISHWEELLQSVSNFIFRLIICKHCGRTPRGVRGFNRSQILQGIEKYSLPGRPSTHHWLKSKSIIEKHQKLRKIIINQLLVNFLPPQNVF